MAPAEAPFSGFVFKIQANMDPKHRDRIAFFRVCSGRYAPAMKVQHQRLGREIKLGNVMTFMANERVASEDAVAGDIIGIHNHGQLQIGDTLTEGEALAYKGIPYFAPELFRVARPRDPFKAKQLQKGLQQLGEEGAIQVFETIVGNSLLLGAVGQLQFEVVAARLASEYKVDAIYDEAGIATARWLTYPDEKARRDFERDRAASLATDVDGNPVYLAPNRFNLQVAMERWPQVGFHATREHGQRMAHASRRPHARAEAAMRPLTASARSTRTARRRRMCGLRAAAERLAGSSVNSATGRIFRARWVRDAAIPTSRRVAAAYSVADSLTAGNSPAARPASRALAQSVPTASRSRAGHCSAAAQLSAPLSAAARCLAKDWAAGSPAADTPGLRVLAGGAR